MSVLQHQPSSSSSTTLAYGGNISFIDSNQNQQQECRSEPQGPHPVSSNSATQPTHRTTKKKLSKLEFRSSPERQAASTSSSPHPKTSNHIHDSPVQNSPKIPLMNFSALVKNNKINGRNSKNNGQRCPSQLDRSKEILSFENELVELLQSAISLTFQQKSAIERALTSAFDLFQVPIEIPTDPEGSHVVERSLIDVASLSLFKRIQAIVTSLSTLIMNTADANHNETNCADSVQSEPIDRRNNISALNIEIDTSKNNFDDSNSIAGNDSSVLQYNKRDQSDHYIAKNNNSVKNSNDSSLIDSQHQHHHQHNTVSNKNILTSPLLDNIDNESLDKLSPLATYNRRRPSSSSYLGSPLKNKKINVKNGFKANDSQTRLNSFSRSSSGIDNRSAISRSASNTSTAYLSNSNMKSVNAMAFENSHASSKTSKPLSRDFDTLSDEESEFSDDEGSHGGGVAGMRRSSSGASFAGGGIVRVASSSPFVKSHQGNGSFLSSNYKNNNGSFINGHRSRSFLADYPAAPTADGSRSRHSVQDFEHASPILDSFKETDNNNSSFSRQKQRNTISNYQFRSPVISPVHDSAGPSKFYSRNNSLLHDTSFNVTASIASPSRKLNRPRSRTFNEFPRENSLRMGSLRGAYGNKDMVYNNAAGNRGSFPGISYNKAKHDYITENGHHGNGHLSGNGFKNDAYIEGFDESLHNTSKLSNNHEYDDMFIDMSKNFDYSSLNSKTNGNNNGVSSKYPQQVANQKNQLKKLEALEKLKVRATSRSNSGLSHRKSNGSHRHSSFQLSRNQNNVYSNARITSSPNPSFSNFEEFVDFVKDTDYKNDNEDDDEDVLNEFDLNDSFLKTRSRPSSVISGRMISGSGGYSGVSATGTGTRSITGAVANHRRISMLQYQQQQAQQSHQQHQQYQQQKGLVSGSSFLSNNYSSNDLGSYNNGSPSDGIYNGSSKFNRPAVNTGRYLDGNKRNTVRF